MIFAAAAVTAIGLTGLAHGQTLKIATLAPDGSGWINTLRDIDNEVRERTDNKVRLKIYPGGVQGNEDVMIRKIRVGQLHGGGFGGTGTSAIFPDVLALEMPFLFEDYDEIEHVLAQTQGYYRRGYSEKGYVLLGWFDIGFVYLFSQKPIAGVEDIRGLKVWRLQGEPVSEVLFAKIGVTSVPLSIPDVLLGLQTDLVEVVYTSPGGRDRASVVHPASVTIRPCRSTTSSAPSSPTTVRSKNSPRSISKFSGRFPTVTSAHRGSSTAQKTRRPCE